MKVVRRIRDLQLEGEVGLVPTMGALHAGHVALFETARAENDVVVASLFVNAAQFDEAADFEAYARDAARDEEIAANAGVDVLFAPTADEMYPPGFATWAYCSPPTVGNQCGYDMFILSPADRPGFRPAKQLRLRGPVVAQDARRQ